MSGEAAKIEVGNPEAAKRRKIGGDLYMEVTGYGGANVHSMRRDIFVSYWGNPLCLKTNQPILSKPRVADLSPPPKDI